jgi:acyl carrier protein
MCVSDSVEQRTCRVVAEVFGLPADQVTLATSHETLEDWDSLNVLNVLMAIEGEFDVTVAPEEAAEFVSVERIVSVLRSKGVA